VEDYVANQRAMVENKPIVGKYNTNANVRFNFALASNSREKQILASKFPEGEDIHAFLLSNASICTECGMKDPSRFAITVPTDKTKKKENF
jgi:hypothetical protein